MVFIRDDSEVGVLWNMLCRSHARAIRQGQSGRQGRWGLASLSYLSPPNPNVTSSSYESANKVGALFPRRHEGQEQK